MTSAFGVDHGDFSKAVRGEEYNSSSPYEKYSAEKKRRRVGVEGAVYGAGATGAGGVATGASAAKIAGTRTGQGLIDIQAKNLKRTNHPLAPHAENAKKVGAWAKANKGKTTAAIIGASTVSGGLGMAARFRRNEEQGISQGVGRIKAGNTYLKDQNRIRKGLGPLTAATSLADVNWNNPAIKAGVRAADKHKKKIGIGAGGAVVGATGYSTHKATQNRKKAAGQLRRMQ